jgi:hypothetical protein
MRDTDAFYRVRTRGTHHMEARLYFHMRYSDGTNVGYTSILAEGNIVY